MIKTPDDGVTSAAFRALGLAASEERCYRRLLEHGATSVSDLAQDLDLSPRGAQRVLSALEASGLITLSPEEVQRYSAVPPDIAADVLIARRHSELHQARAAMVKLRETTEGGQRARPANERFVEILSRQTAGQIFLHSLDSAQREILAMERLPFLVSANDKPDQRLLDCLARGVRSRAITDNQLLKVPGTYNRMRLASEAGEQFRIYPALPFKLVVFDRRMAIIPLHLDTPDGPVLLVRPSSLLDALCEMFEMYWQVSAPFIGGAAAPETAMDSAVLADPLLALLAAGLNDKSIEHELQMSPRTLARRVVELSRKLGASSRFQAGWLAARARYRRDSDPD